jgi:hypothetical protein
MGVVRRTIEAVVIDVRVYLNSDEFRCARSLTQPWPQRNKAFGGVRDSLNVNAGRSEGSAP